MSTLDAPAASPTAPDNTVDYDPFRGGDLARVVPTTEPQREVWLADRLGTEASLAYNESVSLRFRGPLDAKALGEAVQDLVDRHDALRSTLSASGEELMILDQVAVEIPAFDHRTSGAAAEEALAGALRRVVEEPFNLEQGPLFRAELHRLAADEHVLILTAHHIVCDGWSFGVLVEDLATLYARRLEPNHSPPEAAPSFAEFAKAHAAAGGSEENRGDVQFWLSRFAGAMPVLELPLDRPRPRSRTTTSARVDHVLDAELVAELRRMGAKEGASLFATLFTGYTTLIRRLSGQTDVVVGIASAGQSAEGWNTLVGHCVNILPVRLDAAEADSFDAVLRNTRTALLDAFEHQQFTFGTLLKQLAVKRDPSRLPLVSVLFNLDQRVDSERIGFPGLAIEMAATARSQENFELFVNAVPVPEGVRLEAQFNRDLFDAESVQRWLEAYEALLRSAARDPKAGWQALSWLTEREQAALNTLQPAPIRFDSQVPVHERFAEQARNAAQRVALAFGNRLVSYGELDSRSNAIAHALTRAGVGPGSLVGLCLLREPDLYASVFGVLKAGAAFVPLDPAYPKDRLNFMVADSGMSLLVSKSDLRDRVDSDRVLLLDRDLDDEAWSRTQPASPARALEARAPAYVIYTSGSTGKPKGVVVHHHGLMNLLHAMGRRLGLVPEDRLVAVTTMSFDMSIPELFLPLVIGARVVVATREDARDGESLRALLESSGATIMQATPSGWRVLLDSGWQGHPRFRALAGGETVPQSLAEALLARCGEVWNMYGPTETTVWSACARLESFERGVTVGTPLDNNSVWVVDGSGRPCPVGVPGEIWIGGEQVSLGYLNRPELNVERFLPDPFSDRPGMSIYRTGDRGRWRNDGQLEHLGRLDFQVKVRGYRIELGEIEANLSSHPGVDRAVVIVREDQPGDRRLAAYVVARGSAPSADGLREHLRSLIPGYMIPQHIVFLDQIPLSTNGKINRAALPAPTLGAGPERDSRVSPRTDVEAQVLVAIEEVLNLPGLGIHDDFFALGGHSLLAARLASRLSRELALKVPLRVIFEVPTTAGLANWIQAQMDAGGPKRVAIARRTDRTSAPLTRMQHRLWFLEQIDPGRTVYNTPSAHRLRGRLDREAFTRAFLEVVRRQDSLRTAIEVVDDQPVQTILPELPAGCLGFEDLRSWPAAEREGKLRERLHTLAASTFDLSQAPLFQAILFQVSDEEHVFYFGAHHIIWDGWSFDILYVEMTTLYTAFREGRTPTLPDLPLSYGDFAAWHRQEMQGEALAAEVKHWRERLAQHREPLAVPGDKPRPAEMSGRGGHSWISFPRNTADMAREVGRGKGATVFMVLLAAYAAMLQRTTGQRDLVIGMPVRGRGQAELESVMGLFVNVLPLRLAIDPAAPFSELVTQVRDCVLEAFKHPDIPFEELVRELKLPHDRTRFPIYQALFSYQDARQRQTRWGDLEHEMIHVMQPGIAEDLSIWIMERSEGLVGGLGFNADIIEPPTADLLRDRFKQVVEYFVAHPEAPLARLPIPASESKQIAEWNATQVSLDSGLRLGDLMARGMAAHRDLPAVLFEGQSVSYAQLGDRAWALALGLRERGIGPGGLVGVCLERSVDLVSSLVGTIYSGGAYVPLDPTYPAERIARMCEDAGLSVIVTRRDLFARFSEVLAPGMRVIYLDETPLPEAAAEMRVLVGRAEDPAYVIFTSGSTGRPKGAMNSHRGIVNRLLWMQGAYDLSAADRVMQKTPYSFDVSVWEFFWPLMTGAAIVVAKPEGHRDAAYLVDLVRRDNVSVLHFVPSMLGAFLEQVPAEGCGSLRLVVCSGEGLPYKLVEEFFAHLPQVRLENLYGPTEAAVDVTSWTCVRGDPSGVVPIGQPIANTRIYILDESLKPVPIGTPGELYIAGVQVGMGYVARPELTAERFLDDPFVGGERMYKTGDIARWRREGWIEYLGRADFQVKVRGFRIELGEIEAALAAYPAVVQAVVMAREDTPGDVRLVAYVSTRGAPPPMENLRDHLRTLLPPYMVPQHFVALAAIPLLPNGKVDRGALPVPQAVPSQPTASAPREPLTATEQQLAQIWSQLLKVTDIRPQDNFFDLGGHSLLGMQAMLSMETKTGKRVDRGRVLFETLRQIARAYDEAPTGPPPKRGGLKGMLSGLLGR